VVFTNVSVINVDSVQDEVALAVQGDRIAAIGANDAVLKQYPGADVYNGRGKAIVAGLINCHAHLGATLQRGFNEDFGFPNSAKLAVQPGSLLQGEESTLMYTIGALEAIRTGTTTLVEFSSNIARHVPALAKTGLRWVFAEGVRDSENVPGPLSPEGFAKSVTPRFSPKLRDDGMQRINDLFSKWHNANQGRITVFPAASLAETSSP
jgi:5-methylthioadenosine/S-adenosylhomocysteine deaminase